MSPRTPLPNSFQTTRWSLVLQAGLGEPEAKGAALAELCRDYWFPVYAFVRRHGHSHHDAQDLTQGFFERILGQGGFGSAEPTKGKFRSYLLAAAKKHLSKQHRYRNAQKRGGGVAFISIDHEDFEGRFELEADGTENPEVLYHRSWVNTLLSKVLAELEREYRAAGKAKLFEELKDRLAEARGGGSNGETADVLGMSAGAVAVALHRMRGRYRELLRREVRETLPDDETEMDVDAEIQQLLAALH